MTRLCCALVGALMAFAAPAQTPSPWAQPDTIVDEQVAPATPDQLLRQGIDRLSGFMMAGGGASPQRLRAFLDQQVAPYFDFDYMSQWAVGGYYRRLNATQKAALTQRLRELFLGALTRNLGAYAQPLPEIQVLPARAGRTAYEAAVVARVLMPAGVSMKMDFRFYWDGARWRIFDVSANGASAVAFYRDYFTERLRRQGPDLAFR